MCSAFNTLQPHLLFKKLVAEFNLESELALWVFDFLVGRPQQVRVNNTMQVGSSFHEKNRFSKSRLSELL